MKNSSMPVQDIQMFKAEAMKTREDFIVFNGPDEQLVSGLAMGADGGIGGTYGAMPELFLKIYDLVSENRMEEARAIQYDADEIIYKLCSGTCNMYAMIKEVLRVSRGIDIEASKTADRLMRWRPGHCRGGSRHDRSRKGEILLI